MRATHLLTLAGCLLLAATAAAQTSAFPWAENLPQAMSQAEREGKLVLIHFWSNGCAPCRRMDSYVFSRDDVAAAISADYVPVKIDAMEQREIAKRYGVSEWPTDIVVNPYGKKLGGFVGARDAIEYQSLLGQISASYKLLTQADPIAANGETNSAVRVGENSPYQQAQYTQNYQPSGNTYQGRGPSGYGTNWQGQTDGSPYGAQGGGFGSTPSQSGQYNPYGQGQSSPNSYGQNPSGAGSSNPGQYGQGPYGQSPYVQNQYAQNPYGQSSPPAGNQAWPQQQPTNDYGAAANGDSFQAGTPPPNYGQAGAAPSGNGAPTPGRMIDNPYPSQGGTPYVAQQQGEFATPNGSFGPPPVGNAGQSGAPPVAQQAQNDNAPPVAGHPPVALDGYCPVTVIEGNAWRKGDPTFGAVHRGRTYLFASAEAQQQFLSKPDFYSPVFSGYDPVRYVETGELVPGKRNFGVFYDTMYLFADEANRGKFESDPQRYSGAIRQAINQYGLPQRR